MRQTVGNSSKTPSKRTVGWFEDLLRYAPAVFCTNPSCTTCGAVPFRSELVRRAQKEDGFELPQEHRYEAGPLAFELSDSNQLRFLKATVRSMQDVESLILVNPRCPTQPIRLALMELDRIATRRFCSGALEELFDDCPVLEALHSMRKHHTELMIRQRVFEEIRKEKKAKRPILHKARLVKLRWKNEEKARRDGERRLFLDELAQADDTSRARKIAISKWPLESIPPNYRPKDVKAFENLTNNEKQSLKRKIDRRRGYWSEVGSNI